MSRRKTLPDSVWGIIHEKLDILAAYDYRVQSLTQYQYRINGVIDIYPVNKRWHDLRSGQRGNYNDLVNFITSNTQYMTTEIFDPTKASGESDMRRGSRLELNEVSLNGDGSAKEVSPGKWERKGGYFRKRVLIGATKDQKPEEIDLGKEIQVVLLKIRRRLVERGKDGEIVRSTGEHNHPNDAVTLYEPGSKNRINGVARDLREQFPNLRTVQIVYALLCGKGEPELVRLTVKGASLGSEVKADDVMDFYQYIDSFKGDDHFYQFRTALSPVMEEGKQVYFAIKFERGEKLPDDKYEFALGKMEEVHKVCLEADHQVAARIVKAASGEPEEHEVDTTLPEQMTEDVNPDDIPF
jgi:hypothetical protein